jgi:RNA polymerase sigma factor (sigma-70 family)
VVTRAAGGDVAAFDALVRRFQDQAVGYARALVPDAATAEDAAQEAFVEAFLCLSNLREPDAFPVFLRRIVRKQCDRARRSAPRPGTALSLEAASEVVGGAEPLSLLLTAESARRVRVALDALSPREREAVWLYYFGGDDIAGVAAFLGVPPTTVKNRLHTARQRLRKELWEMAEDVLVAEKPSRSEEFAGKVITSIVGEFERQRRADPHTADRGLLTEARAKLDALMTAPEPLDWYAVWSGFHLMTLQDDHAAKVALLERYLSQAIPVSDAAWAHYHRVNSLACGGGTAEATVQAQKEFTAFLVGKKPRLQRDWPFGPIPEGDPNALGDDEIPYWVWCKSGEFARAYQALGRTEEFLRRVNDVFDAVPPSPANRQERFYCLRMAYLLLEKEGDEARAEECIAQMRALSEEETDPAAAEYWQVMALGHQIDLHRRFGRKAEADAVAADIARRLDGPWESEPEWVRGERHDLAHRLTFGGNYPLALRLFERIEASGGQVNPWGYLMYAAAVWGATGDRPRALALIREAACREEREVIALLRQTPNLGPLADDPEFAAAAKKPG